MIEQVTSRGAKSRERVGGVKGGIKRLRSMAAQEEKDFQTDADAEKMTKNISGHTRRGRRDR